MRLVFFGNSARWAFLFRRQDEKTDKTERQAPFRILLKKFFSVEINLRQKDRQDRKTRGFFSLCLAFSVPKILKKTRFESQRYLRERDHEAGRIACRRRTDHGRNDGGSDRWWLFLSCTYFSPRPSSGGNLFDLRPRRIAFASPSSARPPPCSCGGATWAGCLDNSLFVSHITGN